MLQRVRETLTVALLVLLPFHAFFVTVVTRVVSGPGQSPMGSLAVWKEGLLALILLIAVVEILHSWKSRLRGDVLDVCIIALCALGVTVSFLLGLPVRNMLLGIRYDFVPLIAFLLLRRVPWSAGFVKTAMTALLVVGCVVAAYGLLTLALPASFFTAIGYSDLHSLYVPDGPVAAFQFIGGSALRRMQSVMSGPNQLGLWLLLPFSIAMLKGASSSKTQDTSEKQEKKYSFSLELAVRVLCLIAIALTFSRATWIGAVVIGFVWMITTLPRQRLLVVIPSMLGVLVLAVAALTVVRPDIVLRAASSRDHIERPLEALTTMMRNPLGLGLAAAGPASNRVSDACVDLPAGSDASWAKDRPNLCVFVGDVQVQPAGKTCNCPVLPENWYLQIGVETGIAGFVLFAVLILMVLLRLKASYTLHATRYKNDTVSGACVLCLVSCVFFLAVSIAALVLHAWEDAAVAYAAWILVSVALPGGGLSLTLSPWKARPTPGPSLSSTSEGSTRI